MAVSGEKTGGGQELHQERLKMVRKLYREERARLVDYGFQIAMNLSKTFITICAGALVISVTTFKSLFDSPVGAQFLFLAWLFFGLTILISLFGRYLSVFAFSDQRKKLDEWYLEVEGYKSGEFPTVKKSKLIRLLHVLDVLVGVLFVVACWFLGYFGYLNFK